MSDDDTATEDTRIDRVQALLLGLFTTFLAIAFVLLLIGDQVTASSF
ncbi:MAG: hypothetical protein KGN00_11175 [Chloroflexota bacterium]|nr:hypothetical protein [Chloroflexota bacterium]MDE3194238.1 hypothetical protein [Chloroflexota bacterium]